MKSPVLFGVAATIAALSLQTAPAFALSNRAWVSGKGSDVAGCGAPTNACRSFQYVHDHIIAPGGEIDVLDPAGYGSISITKSLSIVNDGVGTAGVQATSGDAITVNAGGADTIFLRGLNVDGLGSANNGLRFISGAKLEVSNCIFRHFNNDGVLISGAVAIHFTGIIASDNGQNGFEVISSGGAVKGSIGSSSADNNGNTGVLFSGDNASVLVDNVGVRNNLVGASNSGIGKVAFSHMAAIGNGTGLSNAVITGITYTYLNNAVFGNTNDLFGLLTPLGSH